MSGISDPSSEDEPLINLVKKRQGHSKVKAPTILREQQVQAQGGTGKFDKFDICCSTHSLMRNILSQVQQATGQMINPRRKMQITRN